MNVLAQLVVSVCCPGVWAGVAMKGLIGCITSRVYVEDLHALICPFGSFDFQAGPRSSGLVFSHLNHYLGVSCRGESTFLSALKLPV